jgi:acetyl-CoA C-acetyltransferase
MNSNNHVEQAAAIVLCSADRAQALGVPADRWVFPHSGTDASDHPFMSNRGDLHSSPAIRTAGAEALALAATGSDEVAHVDLYSCFPSAVQVAAAELGFGLDRQLTVTGGLSFAGGPWNNYVTHAIATMVEVLRADPGSLGLCSANGGLLTKHAFGVYGTEPPADGFRYGRPQEAVDQAPARELAENHEGPVTVETYTVMHGRDDVPQTAFAACLLDDGRRTWGTTQDPDVMKSMTVEEWCGRPMTMRADGTLDA